MKEEQKNKIKSIIGSFIFNIIEIGIIIASGLLMKVKIEEIIILFALFFLARTINVKPMHYKSPLKCMFWSTLIFISFFLLTKVNLMVAIIITLCEGSLLTGRGDIRDATMYRKEDESKYREMKKFIQENKNTKQLKDYEEILKAINEKYQERYKIDFFKVYRLKFYEEKTFKEMIQETNLNDNKEVTKALDIISMSFNTYRQTIES